jgi:hypothetical protein
MPGVCNTGACGIFAEIVSISEGTIRKVIVGLVVLERPQIEEGEIIVEVACHILRSLIQPQEDVTLVAVGIVLWNYGG